jgi:hypothetical protein
MDYKPIVEIAFFFKNTIFLKILEIKRRGTSVDSKSYFEFIKIFIFNEILKFLLNFYLFCNKLLRLKNT